MKGPPQPISQFTITEVLARQEIFGHFDFERALLTSLSAHNNISACCRQDFFPFWLERAPSVYLSVYNNISACRRQDFFGFERAPSAYLSVYNNISACPRQEIFGLFDFERAPSAQSFSVHNNLSAYCR